jgi:hypothetical protein
MILPEYKQEYECKRMLPEWVFPDVMRYYSVSSYGYIHNLATGNYLPKATSFDSNEYVSVHLKRHDGSILSTSLHRIILMTFLYIDGCEYLDVNHKDGIKYHNWIWNLEWVTREENVHHAFSNNLISLGEDRISSVLTNNQVHEICKLIELGYSTKDICNILNYDNCDLRRIICNIKAGLSWKSISSLYDFSSAYKNKYLFTNDQIHFICHYYQTYGKDIITANSILKLIGINTDILTDKELSNYFTCISNIKHKKTFKEICNLYNY